MSSFFPHVAVERRANYADLAVLLHAVIQDPGSFSYAAHPSSRLENYCL
jgi:hypothetical protein